MSIGVSPVDSYHILYREVQSGGRLKVDDITESNEIQSIHELLDDVRENVEDFHKLDDLDVSSFFRDWITTILAKSGDIQGSDIDDELEKVLEYIAEDFSDSMMSRAREQGKYVVFIISEDSFIACHSFTGKKAVTTDMEVIEELLSESNIDKFAEFQYDPGRDVVVNHFDRNDTQSFTNWLGIPEGEIVFDIKGDVRVYTEIDELDAVFEFDQDDITQKLLGSDKYDLSDGLLQTPNEPPRRVNRIMWGHSAYTNVGEFKQDLLKTTHNLARAFELYDTEISNTLDSFFDVIDYEDKIVKDKGGTPESIQKPNVDFELLFVNKQVRMEIAWRSELTQNLFSDHDPIPICHAGSEFSERPFRIGNFRIYNELDLSEDQTVYVNDLLKTAEDMGSANLRPMFAHIAFELLSNITPKPLRHLFNEFSVQYRSNFLEGLEDGSRVIQTEGEEIGLEWKSPPWFDRKSNSDDLAEGLNREFQSSRLVLLGISEDGKDIEVIESGVKSEQLNSVEEALENDYGVAEAHVWSLPIDDGHGIIALNVTTESDSFSGDLSLFQEPE